MLHNECVIYLLFKPGSLRRICHTNVGLMLDTRVVITSVTHSTQSKLHHVPYNQSKKIPVLNTGIG